MGKVCRKKRNNLAMPDSDLEGEDWRTIPDTDGLYQVSNKGRVSRVRVLGRCVLKPRHGNIKYPTVYLSVHCKRKRCTIHRLVANAFLPNPDNLPQVNHKDENPCNNDVSNLEWCSELYNHRYGTGTSRGHLKLSKRIRFENKEYDSIRECARQTNRLREYIRSHCEILSDYQKEHPPIKRRKKRNRQCQSHTQRDS